MASHIDFTLSTHGQTLLLRSYGTGALYSLDQKTLFLSDPHFGKADSFRHAGIPIPNNLIEHDLARLELLMASSSAQSLVILGDFFHTRQSQSDHVLDSIYQWRMQHTGVEITLIKGNHDLHAGDPPSRLSIRSVDPPYALGPFICHHEPPHETATDGYVLAGHLHPTILLRDRDGTRITLPAFIFGQQRALLPAFGAFTGGAIQLPRPGDRVFAISQGELYDVPTTRAVSKRR